MNSWIKGKLKYTKQQENGTFKRVSEPYILAAMTFTDAEARIYEELGEIIRGEFIVLSIERFDVHDMFHFEDSDVWYETIIKFRSESDGDEKAKQVRQKFLVSASSVAEATARTHESLSTMMVDFEVTSTKVTPIVDIFPSWKHDGSLFLPMESLRIRGVPCSYFFPIASIMLHGKNYPCPADSSSFLEERYGPQWKVPDPYYEWPWKLTV
jgi:hypothetical protein